MPITKSAKKALCQNEKRAARNRAYKNKMKALIKKIRTLALAKKTEEAKKLLPEVYKILDKSAKENIIKKNTASRQKSRLAKSIKS
jgi:small subunit ribosomal protein S20